MRRSLRPEARRTLFEEAAGIAPHLRKRSEALRRIEETEHNLERVNDILAELQPRSATLHRQAERAQEYLLLSQDLKELQRIWYGYQWQRWQRRFLDISDRIKEQEARSSTQHRQTYDLQETLEQFATQQDQQRQVIDNLSAKQSSLRDEDTLWRRELAIVVERTRLYQQQQAALQREIDTLSRRREIVQEEVDKATTEIGEHEAAYAASRVELAAARQQLSEVDAARADGEASTGRAKKHGSAHRAAFRTQGSPGAGGGATHILGCGEARACRQTGRTRRGAAETARQGQELNAREEAIEAARLGLQGSHDLVESQIAATREQLATEDQELAKIQGERDRLVSRHEALTRVQQELAGYHPGVREVLSREAGLAGLLGTVASLMVVPQHLEQAIESALGARLQNVVAERWEDAEAAIAFLKRKRGGWATFLPLDTIRSRSPLALRQESGVVGVASTLVRFDEKLRVAFELLLGSIIVVRDLPTARRLLEKRTGASLLVTLEGETVQPNGALSGGSRRESSNLLAQERERRDLPEHIQRTEQNWPIGCVFMPLPRPRSSACDNSSRMWSGNWCRVGQTRRAPAMQRIDRLGNCEIWSESERGARRGWCRPKRRWGQQQSARAACASR